MKKIFTRPLEKIGVNSYKFSRNVKHTFKRLVVFDIETVCTENIKTEKLRFSANAKICIACFELCIFETEFDIYRAEMPKILRKRTVSIRTQEEEKGFLELISDPKTLIVMQNIEFELGIMRGYSEWVTAVSQGRILDTMVLARRLNFKYASLAYLANTYKLETKKGATKLFYKIYANPVFYETDDLKQVAQWAEMSEKEMQDLFQLFIDYCINDCIVTRNLFIHLWRDFLELSPKDHSPIELDVKYMQTVTISNYQGLCIDMVEVDANVKVFADVKAEAISNTEKDFPTLFPKMYKTTGEIKTTCSQYLMFAIEMGRVQGIIPSDLPSEVSLGIKAYNTNLWRSGLNQAITLLTPADMKEARAKGTLTLEVATICFEGVGFDHKFNTSGVYFSRTLAKITLPCTPKGFINNSSEQKTGNTATKTGLKQWVLETPRQNIQGKFGVVSYTSYDRVHYFNPFLISVGPRELSMKYTTVKKDKLSVTNIAPFQKKKDLPEPSDKLSTTDALTFSRAIQLVKALSTNQDENKLLHLQDVEDVFHHHKGTLIFYPFITEMFKAKTGRTASAKLNVLNFPKGESLARKLLVSRQKGYVTSADYSSIEVRVGAWLCYWWSKKFTTLNTFGADEADVDYYLDRVGSIPQKITLDFLDRYNDPEYDLYKYIAGQIYNVPTSEIGNDDKRRSLAKSGVLGFGFGLGKTSFQTTYGISAEETTKIYEGYHEILPLCKPIGSILEGIILSLSYSATARRLLKAKVKAVYKPNCNFEIFYVDNIIIPQPLGCSLVYRDLVIFKGETAMENAVLYDVPFLDIKYISPSKTIENTIHKLKSGSKIYSSKILQNLIQACSFNVLQKAIVNVVEAGLDFMISIHDEILLDHKLGSEADKMVKEMTRVEEDFKDPPLPLKVDKETKLHY